MPRESEPTSPSMRSRAPLAPAEWQPDTDACSVCDVAFGLTRRRHHCRICGHCVCKDCGASRVILDNSGIVQRACSLCLAAAVNGRSLLAALGQLNEKLHPLQLFEDIPAVRGPVRVVPSPSSIEQAVSTLERVVISCETRHKQLQCRVGEMLYRLGEKDEEKKALAEENDALKEQLLQSETERDALQEKLSRVSEEHEVLAKQEREARERMLSSIAQLGQHIQSFGARCCSSYIPEEHAALEPSVEACENLLCELEQAIPQVHRPASISNDQTERDTCTSPVAQSSSSSSPVRRFTSPALSGSTGQLQITRTRQVELRDPQSAASGSERGFRWLPRSSSKPDQDIEHWQQDTDACGICGKGLGKRRLAARHHCRQCGTCVCSNCSPSFVQLDPKQGPQRTCTPCITAAFEALQTTHVDR